VNAKRNQGFTLIELLVVIAIIGILSAVVLASLSTARNKGNDASVKSNLHTVITQAAVYFSDNGNTYGDFNDGLGGPAICPVPSDTNASVFGDTVIKNAIASAIAYTPVGGVSSCHSTNTTFVTAVSRPSVPDSVPPSVYWCVDSTGQSCGTNDLPPDGSCGACASTN